MSYDQDQRRKAYVLDFTPYPGLTVTTRKPPFLALEALTRAVLILGADFQGTNLPINERMAGWRDLFSAFAMSLVSWDLTDRGHSVPATEAGVLSQDLPFLLAVSRTWYTLVASAPEFDERETASEPEPIHESGERFTNGSDALSNDDEAWLESFQTTTLTPELTTDELNGAVELPEIEHDIAPVPDGPRA